MSLKKFTVTFQDEIRAESEEHAYELLLAYLRDVVRFEDVTAFDFEEQPLDNTADRVIVKA